jgi:putative addiction module component (TIGR02574 family)
MTLPLDALEAEVLNLPPVERSHLLDRLIASLEADSEIQKAWAIEAERRDGEVEEGKVALVPGEEVLARLHADLRACAHDDNGDA